MPVALNLRKGLRLYFRTKIVKLPVHGKYALKIIGHSISVLYRILWLVFSC